MSTIYTSTPRAMLLGVKDMSERSVPLEDITLPCHLPWAPTFAAKGDTMPHLLRSGGAVAMYGSDTFDVTSKYATHQTPFINLFAGNGNPVMYQRILPDGAKTSLLRFSVEVIETLLPNYVRNEAGQIQYNFNEYDQRVPVIDGQIVGHRLVFHTTLTPWTPTETLTPDVQRSVTAPEAVDPASLFGLGTVVYDYRSGSETAADGTLLGELLDEVVPRSNVFPIFDLLVASPGSYGDRLGLRIQLPTLNGNTPIDSATMYANLAYLPRIGIVEKDYKGVGVKGVETAFGELFQDVTFKRGTRDDVSDVPMAMEERIIEKYRRIGGSTPDIEGPFGQFHMYHENLEAVLSTLVAKEAEYNEQGNLHGRYPLETASLHMLNFLGGFDETGAPYYTIETNKSALFGGEGITADCLIFARGGDDGLLYTETGEPDQLANYEIFDTKVRQIMESFGEGEVRFLNYAKYPISAIWDSGYSMDTKKALLNPIGLRKDIAVFLATHTVADYTTTYVPAVPEPVPVPEPEPVPVPVDPLLDGGITDPITPPVVDGNGSLARNTNSVGGTIVKTFAWSKPNDEETEISIAGTLRTLAGLYPESEVYGTPVCRAVIVGHSGRIINSNYTLRLPLTYELADKVSKFMGSAEGFWNSDAAYDQRGNNIVEKMRDVNLTWKQENVANQAWANGLVYVEDFDTRRLFFPAVRTVYNKETSVLNSSITMLAICYIERICHQVWRDLVGNSKFSQAKFIQESDRIIEERLAKRFDDRFIIEAETVFTEADVARNYSWTCRVHIYAAGMKTVGSYTVVAHRIEDYELAAA